MRKKGFKIILFFSLFLVLFSVGGYAVEYLTDLGFNVTDVHRGELIKAYANWSETVNSSVIAYNLSYSDQSESALTNYTTGNETYNETWTNYSITTDTSTSLGLHGVIIYVNSTFEGSTVGNKTTMQNFTVWGLANTTIYLNSSEIIWPEAVNITCFVRDIDTGLGVENYNLSIFDGDTLLSSALSNPDGNFSIIYQPSAANLNHMITCNISNNETLFYNATENGIASLTVNKAPTNISLWLNGTERSRSYNQNDPANFTAQVNISELKVNLISPDYPGWVEQTNTKTIYNETILSSIGIFNITAYTNGNYNYSASSRTYYFDTRRPQYYNLVVNPSNNSDYLPNQNYSFNTTITDASIDTVVFRFYNKTETGGGTIDKKITVTDYVSINDTTRMYHVNLKDLPAGSYNYSWFMNDTLGTSNSTGNLTYVVGKADAIGLSVSPNTAVTSNTETTVTCTNSNKDAGRNEVSETLKLEADSVYNPHEYELPVGTWNYYCSAPNTGNYTNVLKTVTMVVSQLSTSPPTSPPSSSGITPSGGKFLVTDLPSSLSIEAGKSKPTTFKLKNTLDNNVVNITLSLSGISSSWYTMSEIDAVPHGTSKSVTITFNIPETAEAKDYSVTVTAKGKPLTGSTRTATKTMKLKVTEPEPKATLPSEEVEENVTIETTAQENISSNETVAGPTGLAATFEYLKNNVVIVIAIASCLLIFIFRNNITTGLMKAGGKKIPKKRKRKKGKTGFSLSRALKRAFNYKIKIGFKKGRGRKRKAKKVSEEVKEIRRPEVLEREIKRDIKELQQIIEAEKKIEKKKK